MSTLRVRAAILVALSVMSVGALPVSAAAPRHETFYLTQQDDYDTIAWESDGVFTDAGTWEKGRVTFSGGKSPVFAGMIETMLTNAARTGSFRMDFEGLGYNATGAFSGRWSISQGTGIFAGLHGTGTWYEVDIPDPDHPGHLLLTFPCTGQVHLDPAIGASPRRAGVA